MKGERKEAVLTPFAFLGAPFDFDRFDDEIQVWIPLPRTNPQKAVPTVWVTIGDFRCARAALANEEAGQ